MGTLPPPVPHVAQTAQVVRQDFPIVAAQAVVPKHARQGVDHIIQFTAVPAAGGVLALEFIQLLPGALEAVLIGADGKGHRLDVLDVLANAIEEAVAPAIAAEVLVTIAMKGVIVARPAVAVPIPISIVGWRR